jgi:hypothetical protein
MADSVNQNTEVNPVTPGGLPSDNNTVEPTALDKLIEENPKYAFLKDTDPDDIAVKLSEQQANVQSGNNDATQVPAEVMQDMVAKFIANGNQLTDEITESLKANGIDERDIKIGAYELTQRINEAYKVVGGKDEYEAMVAWAKESLPQEDKEQFNSELSGANGKFAIMGLHSLYSASKGGKQHSGRITGNQTAQSTVEAGYATKKDMLADMAYLRNNPRDNDAKRRYEAKMRKTNPAILR